ncbi:MAG TPA: hypothetical protein PLY70_07950 [Saprospiraceae bacterium]|nr:hypothetical protein [Saprospiraceae bacterium]HPN69798.1 hypothetical protein [Saprospiraceae bacterium]
MSNLRSTNSTTKSVTSKQGLWNFLSLFLILGCCNKISAQLTQDPNKETKIVISGARFTGDLLKHWISAYESANPTVKFVLEDKGTVEFSEADIIIHGHQPTKSEIYENRSYISFARFAVLPIANVKSPFAKAYGEKGLKKSELKQAFFFNPLDRIDEKPLKMEFNVYSRIQQASSPIVFAKTFGYEQNDLHGRLISGTDHHLVQAVSRDSLGISYAPLALIYDLGSGIIKDGLIVIPIDADDNGKISNDEKSYSDLTTALSFITKSKFKNLPVSDIQFSIKKQGAGQEVNRFLTWVFSKGIVDLENFGFLKLEEKTIEQNLTTLAKYTY